jgi:2-aminophenol/2-amino-5-chlorophenol 1,6-dioxygenase alpha subunit
VSAATEAGAALGIVVPGRPQPLLAPDRNAGWARLREAFETLAGEIEKTEADLMVLYSTSWPSVIGHQIQADPEPEWVHVDPEWHDLGSMAYRFRMDADFAEAYQEAATARGLHARTVAYKGFPIDTGTVVALQLLNPGNRLPACVVSCNMYADRAETLVLGKAAADALRSTGKRAVAVAVTALSNRMFSVDIDPAEDRISSAKDDEWNRKILEILGEGRLEDVSQLARSFTTQANADSKLKAIWWLAALMGQHNKYSGRVFAYEALWGTGAAVCSLTPADQAMGDLEFDEDDVERYRGDRDVLAGALAEATAAATEPPQPPPEAEPGPDDAPAQPEEHEPAEGIIRTRTAPDPVGAYPHARRVGELLFLSGCGPRQPGSNEIPGGPVRDEAGEPLPYDVRAQTRAVLDNVRAILEASGSSFDRILDVTVFLIDMERDFPAFNEIYAEAFQGIGATRTTIEVRALPTPIAVELKVLAQA